MVSETRSAEIATLRGFQFYRLGNKPYMKCTAPLCRFVSDVKPADRLSRLVAVAVMHARVHEVETMGDKTT